MKWNWDKKLVSYGITAFLVIAAGILFFALIEKMDVLLAAVGTILDVLMPLLMGLVIAYLLNPLMMFFENTCYRKINIGKFPSRLRRVLSVVSTFVLALLFVAGLFYLVLPQVAKTIVDLVNNLPEYFNSVKEWLNGLMAEHKFLADFFGQDSFQSINELQSFLMGMIPELQKLITDLSSGVIGFVSGVANLIIGCIAAIYLLYNKERFGAQSKKVLFAVFPKRFTAGFLDIMTRTDRMFSSFLFGKFLDSMIIGLICFLGMTILQIPFAALVAVVIAVFNMIPFFGPIIGAIPCVLLILLDDPVKALWFLIFIIVLQQFDGNVLGPRILGNQVGLSGFWVMFAIIVFGGFFGFLGMIVGVPIFGVVYSLIRMFVENRLKGKGMPVSTSDYLNKEERSSKKTSKKGKTPLAREPAEEKTAEVAEEKRD